MTLRVFYSTGRRYLEHNSGLDWENMYWVFIMFLRSPAVCTGHRALPDPAQFWHWVRRHCPPCSAMLVAQLAGTTQVGAGAFSISCSLLFFCHLPWSPGGPLGLPVPLLFSSLQGHHCRPGWGVTLPQAPPGTSKSIALRSPKAHFKYHLYRNKNCLQEYIQQPEKITVLLRSGGCPGNPRR